VSRKKGKSLTLFLLLLLVTVSVMTGISIRNGTEKAAQNLRETIGASFTMSGNISSLELDGDEAEYTTEKIPVPVQTVMQILSMDGIKAYNAEQHSLIQAEGINYLSGMTEGNLSANTDTAYQTDFVNGILELSEGRHITAEDKGAALISDRMAEENHLGIGSEIILKSDSENRQEQTKVRIAGIYSSDSKIEYDDDTIFSSHDVFWQLSGQETSAYAGNVTFYVNDPEELNQIVALVKQISSIQWDNYFIKINESEYQAVSYQLQTLERLTGMLIFAVMIVGVIVIALVLTMRIRNRIHEVGILLSIGTSSAEITVQFVCEVLMILSFVFIVSPILGNFIIAQVETALRNTGNAISMSVSPIITLVQFLLETFIIIIVVIAASLSVTRMKPKDILSKMS
jgi:putative ABC transport system permease protein